MVDKTVDTIDFRTVNINNIEYENPVRIKNNFLAKCKNELVINTGLLKCCGPVSVVDNNLCYLTLELRKRADFSLYNFFIELDEKNICEIFENSLNWFNKEMPLDVIEDFLTPSIRLTKKKICVKVRVPFKRKKVQLENYENLKKGKKISAILRYNGIKFKKHQFMSDWELVSFLDEEQYSAHYDFYEDELLDEHSLLPILENNSLDVNDFDENDLDINQEEEEHVEENLENTEENLENTEEELDNEKEELEHDEENNDEEELEHVEENSENEELEHVEEETNEDELENVEENNEAEELENVEENNETEELEHIEDENNENELEHFVENNENEELEKIEENVEKVEKKRIKKKRKRKILKTNKRRIIIN